MDIAISINGVSIRLTSERWLHIVENHDDVAGYYEEVLNTVEDPELVIPGYKGSLTAVRNFGHRRYLMVIYRELSDVDGFVITAFFIEEVDRKKALWKKQS